MKRRVVVIGGGAAGLMAAGCAARRGLDVLILDKNYRPGRKLMITGKGRCNLTNNCDVQTLIANTVHGGKFLYSAFSAFGPAETMAFFESLGVPLKTERGRRVCPVSDRAADIVDALKRFAVGSGALYKTAEAADIITENGAVAGVLTAGGEKIYADAAIVCTGGLSYPSTGSTGDGYALARKAGHSVTPLVPSLVPLTMREGWCRTLQGLSLKNVAVKLIKAGVKKPVFSELGEMLFTHYGVSGPLVLSASAHIDDIKSGEYQLHIDLKPALDEKKLYDRINRDLTKYSAKSMENAMVDLLPHRMIQVVLRLAGIPAGTRACDMTREYRLSLANTLKGMVISIKDYLGYDEAVITRGGVSLKELDPKTMQSRKVHGLAFAGEVIDADAYTGGYNLQIAFSTGHAAGEHILENT